MSIVIWVCEVGPKMVTVGHGLSYVILMLVVCEIKIIGAVMFR